MDTSVILIAMMFLGLAVIGKIVFRNIVNPVTVFCGVWALIFFAYSFHAYGLYQASSKSLALVAVGVVLFFIGASAATVIRYPRSMNTKISSGIIRTVYPNYLFLLILNAMSFAFLFGFGIDTVRMLLSGKNFSYIHHLYNQETGTLGASRLYQNIVTWYVWPVMDASIATLAVTVQTDRRKTRYKKMAFLLVLINLLLFIIITGKRSHLGYIVMYMIAVFLLQGKRIKIKRKTKILILLGFVASILLFDAISTSRGSTSILRTLYLYFVGCIPHLSIKLDSMPTQSQGIASIYGIYQGPLIIINSFLHSSWLSGIRNSMSELIAITQERVLIGPNTTFNAFLTPFYYFYRDGGMAGNIILSFLFGFVSTSVYLNHLKKRSYKSMVLYLLVFFTLYMSMVRIQFFQMRFTLSFFYALLLFKKRKTIVLNRIEEII